MVGFVSGIVLYLIATVNGKAMEDPITAVFARHEEKERSVVDMGELGTFDTGYPFDYPRIERFYSAEPDSRENIGTEFRFFSPKNKDVPQYVTNMNFSSWDVKKSGFFRGWKTFFLIHGYNGGNSEWQPRLKKALLNKMKCNVFIVDWSEGDGPWYEQAVANIRVVGAEVGLFIKRMMDTANLYPEFVHIIGHSLGAHASGYAGKWLRDRQKTLIDRITGLDPAGPFFNGVEKIVRLDMGDASFVDVIHTNWAGFRLSGYGLEEAIGHVDFYPNGGEDQPGCETALEATMGVVGEALSYLNGWALVYKYATTGTLAPEVDKNVKDMSCSHSRAYEYFIASLEEPECKFQSLICYSWEAYVDGKCGTCETSTCINMGYNADRHGYGLGQKGSLKFYLRTKESAPYCMEKK